MPTAVFLSTLFQFNEYLAGDFLQRFEHALTLEGNGFNHGFILFLQFLL